MTTPEPNGLGNSDARDRHLLGQIAGSGRRGNASSRACPGLSLLAAYADGRMTEPETDLVETHLVECPVCLDLLRDLRESEGVEPPAAPEAVITAAKALVPASGGLRLVGGWPARLRSRPAARWGMATAAAASIAACIVGYHLGTSSFEISERTTTMLVGEMSFGAIDADEDSEFAVLVAALPEGER